MDNDLIGICRQGIDNSGFFVLKNVLSQDLLTYVLGISNIEKNNNKSNLIFSEEGSVVSEKSNVPGNSEYEYSSIKSDALFYNLTDIFRAVTNRNLVPSFSFYRTYYEGSSLEKHKDRGSCQYAITTQVGSHQNKPWDIYITDFSGQDHCVTLDPGDVLFYRGELCAHWREPLENEWSSHFFLFWIDKDQPEYKQYQLDDRENLGDKWTEKFNKVL